MVRQDGRYARPLPEACRVSVQVPGRRRHRTSALALGAAETGGARRVAARVLGKLRIGADRPLGLRLGLVAPLPVSCSQKTGGRRAVLHPPHEGHEAVGIGVTRHHRGEGLPEIRRAGPPEAVAHAGYEEEAEELLRQGKAAAGGDGALVVVHDLLEGDGRIGKPRVDHRLPTPAAEVVQVDAVGVQPRGQERVQAVDVAVEVEGFRVKARPKRPFEEVELLVGPSLGIALERGAEGLVLAAGREAG